MNLRCSSAGSFSFTHFFEPFAFTLLVFICSNTTCHYLRVYTTVCGAQSPVCVFWLVCSHGGHGSYRRMDTVTMGSNFIEQSTNPDSVHCGLTAWEAHFYFIAWNNPFRVLIASVGVILLQSNICGQIYTLWYVIEV